MSDATKPVSAEEVAQAVAYLSEGPFLPQKFSDLASLLQRLAQERDDLAISASAWANTCREVEDKLEAAVRERDQYRVLCVRLITKGREEFTDCEVFTRAWATTKPVSAEEVKRAWANTCREVEDKLEAAVRERDQYRDALVAKHGGEPIALLEELDQARAELTEAKAAAAKAREIADRLERWQQTCPQPLYHGEVVLEAIAALRGGKDT